MTMSPSTTSFIAFSTGSQVPSPIPALTTYTLSESSAIVLSYVGGGQYNFASGGHFDLTLASGSFTLIGTLSVQDLSQTASSGTINTTIVANFDITGGTYCSASGSTCGSGVGYGKVFLTLSSATPPVTNGSHGGLDAARIVLPAGNTAITPEPASLLLFGTGLLVLGGTLRRRLLGSA
jgi:hypothetical protein